MTNKTKLFVLALVAGLALPAAAEEEARTRGKGENRGSCPHFTDEDGDGRCDAWVDEDGDGICDDRREGYRLRHRATGPRDGTGRGAGFRGRGGRFECEEGEDCRRPGARRGRGHGPRDGTGRGEALRDGEGRGKGPRDGTGFGPRRGRRTGPQDRSGPGCSE